MFSCSKFNLTTILYAEPEKVKNSAVVAVVKDENSEWFGSFKSLKGKIACFPKYGGIAWLSLINVARSTKLIPNTCNYPEAIAKLFGGACAPGINDTIYSDVAEKIKPEIVEKLCSACRLEANHSTCSESPDNMYYADHEVLECVKTRGDIGFVELGHIGGKLREGSFNPYEYRVLCKNGSLASNAGFDIDEDCALSITVDSEVCKIRYLRTKQHLLASLFLYRL